MKHTRPTKTSNFSLVGSEGALPSESWSRRSRTTTLISVKPLNRIGEGAVRAGVILLGIVVLLVGVALAGIGLLVWKSAVADYGSFCTGVFQDVDVDCPTAWAKTSTFAGVALVGVMVSVIGLILTILGSVLKRERPSQPQILAGKIGPT